MKTLNEEYPLYPVPEFTSLQQMVQNSAQLFGDKLALEDLTDTPLSRLSYRQLFDTAARFAQALRRVGVTERDHVAVIAENRVQWAVAYLACMVGNLVAVPVDKSLRENEVFTILHASDAKAVVYSEAMRDTVLSLAPAAKNLKVFVDMDLAERDGKAYAMMQLLRAESASGLEPLPTIDPHELGVIVFTSGAMGRAKGVMLSQGNIAANLRAMLSMIELLPADRFLSVLPIHHTYECTCGLLCPLTVGSSVHFARSLKTVLEDMQRVHATILLGVPMLYDKMYKRIVAGMQESKLTAALVGPLKGAATLVEAAGIVSLRRTLFRRLHDRFGGAVRILIVGGAAPNPAVASGLRSLGFTLIQGYGLTETSPIVALNRLRKFRDDAAGVPLPGLEIRVSEPDEEGRGEILVRGPSVMLGYYKNEEATRHVLKDGWFATGDYGFLDRDGFLRVSGRKKNVIVAANGKNVFPEELEDLINNIPLVLESAVCGVEGPSGSEEIAAVVVPNAEAMYHEAGKTGREVSREWIAERIDREIRALNRKLPLYKQIRHVRIRDVEFEKTTTQKIKRYLLRQEASSQ